MKAIICFIALFIGTLTLRQGDIPNDIGDDHTHPPPLPVAIPKYDCKGHRNDKCNKKYGPTCGWFDPKKIQCFAYPCAVPYSNACKACKNRNVKYVTCGSCPPTGTPNPSFAYFNSLSSKLPKCSMNDFN